MHPTVVLRHAVLRHAVLRHSELCHAVFHLGASPCGVPSCSNTPRSVLPLLGHSVRHGGALPLALSPALTGVSGDGPVSISGLRPSSLRLLLWSAPRYAVPCCAKPLRQHCAMQCFSMASCAMQGYAMPCCAMRSWAAPLSTQCYATMCFAMLRQVTMFHPFSGPCSGRRH